MTLSLTFLLLPSPSHKGERRRGGGFFFLLPALARSRVSFLATSYSCLFEAAKSNHFFSSPIPLSIQWNAQFLPSPSFLFRPCSRRFTRDSASSIPVFVSLSLPLTRTHTHATVLGSICSGLSLERRLLLVSLLWSLPFNTAHQPTFFPPLRLVVGRRGEALQTVRERGRKREGVCVYCWGRCGAFLLLHWASPLLVRERALSSLSSPSVSYHLSHMPAAPLPPSLFLSPSSSSAVFLPRVEVIAQNAPEVLLCLCVSACGCYSSSALGLSRKRGCTITLGNEP